MDPVFEQNKTRAHYYIHRFGGPAAHHFHSAEHRWAHLSEDDTKREIVALAAKLEWRKNMFFTTDENGKDFIEVITRWEKELGRGR